MTINDKFNLTPGWDPTEERWLPVFVDADPIKPRQPGTRKCFPRKTSVLHLQPPELKLLLLLLCRIKGFYYMLLSFVTPPPWGKICSHKQASLLIEGTQSGADLKPLNLLCFSRHTAFHIAFISFLLIPLNSYF